MRADIILHLMTCHYTFITPHHTRSHATPHQITRHTTPHHTHRPSNRLEYGQRDNYGTVLLYWNILRILNFTNLSFWTFTGL